MKRTFIFTGIGVVCAFLFLYVFNKVTSKTNATDFYTEVKNGEFEIALTEVGELIAEKSVDISGPDFSQRRYVRSRNIKIQDLIPEGTVVKKGDYIASLDRTELENSLKDQLERLITLHTELEMKKLDTAVVLNALRDEVRNQSFLVDEAAITLRNSKYEPPTSIRQAEIHLDKAQRVLEQRRRSYKRKVAQSKTDIINQKYNISRIDRRAKDLEEILAGFTITAPSSGMVIYKREWGETKRKVGSTINPFDRVIATLPDLTSMLSKTFVNEIDVSKIKEGQIVNITIDAFPEKSFTGFVSSIANIGEKLLNTNDKVFEVQIKIDGSDPLLRPSMTTGNKIIIKTVNDAVYVPIECVHAGVDSIPFVYTKNGNKQIVLLGYNNEKNIIIEEGLDPGVMIYLNNPETPERFKIVGEDIIPVLKERENTKRAENESYIRQVEITP
ncbi:MAG TPA: efflux RND transporter periplasmic adaptor subunit [Bacteroidales bacterium]|nr:efflux RND transporter periplasmic adaptor subunit [Bacteroidales bacterium]